MDLLLVGCGNMGGAMLRRWVGFSDVRTSVVDPVAAAVPGASVHASERRLPAGRFDVVVLAVKPQLVGEVAPAYGARLAPDGVVVSIAAGTPLSRLAGLLPGARLVRAMPNLPAQTGKGVTALYAGADLGAARAGVDRLFAAVGETIWVGAEDMIDRFTAVAGSGPGYVFEIARAFVAAAEAHGFEPQDARRIVLATLEGAAAMAKNDPRKLADLRDAVTSRRGTTEAGLEVLMREDVLVEIMQATVDAAYARAIELREGR